MISKVCGTCRHWNAGFCCRFPPVANPMVAAGYAAEWFFVFPETKPDDTCGEWYLKSTGPTVTTYTVAIDELIERRAE